MRGAISAVETCSCGASIDVTCDFNSSLAERLAEFRKDHHHETTLAARLRTHSDDARDRFDADRDTASDLAREQGAP